MTSSYANIQRNRNIFNQITKTNKYKQETIASKSSHDLESSITKLALHPQKS